jgi:hypothetical protein
MVIKPRSAIGMAAIWLVAVAGVSATAWLAIDRAGRDLTSTSANSLAPAPLITPTLGPGPTKATALPGPSATTKPAPTPKPSPTRTHRSTPPPVATPTPVAMPRVFPTPRTSPRDQSSPSPKPTAQDRTLAVTGGIVAVRCTGAVIALRVAQPDNQWRVLVDTSQPGQILVTFTSGEEEDQHKTQVMSVCTNGTPAFSSNNR